VEGVEEAPVEEEEAVVLVEQVSVEPVPVEPVEEVSVELEEEVSVEQVVVEVVVAESRFQVQAEQRGRLLRLYLGRRR
jgi:hypothetical protein